MSSYQTSIEIGEKCLDAERKRSITDFVYVSCVCVCTVTSHTRLETTHTHSHKHRWCSKKQIKPLRFLFFSSFIHSISAINLLCLK